MVETSDYSDSCSFYSESWGEESELSSELAVRPASPGTAVQQQPSDLNIAGFRATWLVGSWANRARRRRRATKCPPWHIARRGANSEHVVKRAT